MFILKLLPVLKSSSHHSGLSFLMQLLKSLDQITSADGFTQASVESRQMSSTGGTTEVSTKGTAITTTQPVIGDETVMQMGQGMWMNLLSLQKEKKIYII